MDESLPSRLIRARSMLGWSQQQLAEASGVAAAQISRYELGRSRPRTEVLAKLAQAMNVPLGWLMYEPQTNMAFAFPRGGDGLDAAIRANAGIDDAGYDAGPTTRDVWEPSGEASSQLSLDPLRLLKLVEHLSEVHEKRKAFMEVRAKLVEAGTGSAQLAALDSAIRDLDREIVEVEKVIRSLVL